MRNFLDSIAEPAPDSVTITDHHTSSSDGHRVLVRTYRPIAAAAGALPCVFRIYGGGLITGSITSNDWTSGSLAAELGVAVAAVEYRVAPEARYPAAIDDCHAGYTFIEKHADELEMDPDRVAILGVSAGGGLAAALALRLRDRGNRPPRLLLLRYPMLDDRNTTTSSHAITDNRTWSREFNLFGWNAYLDGRAGSDDVLADAAPARADDLTGFPATAITVGGLDLFLDENMTFAQRLAAAGVDTELHVYPGAFHGVHNVARDSVLVGRWLDDEHRALRRALFAP
ncbi:MAG: alpha/beta hydrolase [Actinomycetia bacterium]|nr:alpha/beta hydrolase [Actinomycetes bacterium]